MPTKQPTQLTMFGVSPIKEATFHVYHDESGTEGKKDRFLFHGALFVPDTKWSNALALLAQSRGEFQERLHFQRMRDYALGSAKAVKAWLNLYAMVLSDECRFKCMIVDTQSPAFERARFKRPFHIYNYFAMQAVYSGVVWSLQGYDQVCLYVHSEAKDREADDNFVSYLPQQVMEKTNRNPKSPQISLGKPDVVMVNGNPRKVETELAGHCEFIQLTDLLTSAVAEAVHAKATKEIKLDMAQLVANWIVDTRKPPWLQAKELHRRFSVSCFPDSRGGFYDCPLAVTDRNQPSLF